MTAVATTESTPASRPIPSRFREAEARGYALGKGIRVFGRVSGTIDEALMTRIGEALTEGDPIADALAGAIKTRAADRAPGEQRVTHAELREALATGAVPDDAAPALRDFIADVTTVPEWVNWDLVDEGAAVLRRFGRNASDVMLQLSLIGGYRYGGPTDFLVTTGGLTGRQTLRRLAETQHWGASIGNGAELRPGGESWRLTVHVRVMHALVNATHRDRWNIDRWGLPINMADMAGTLGLFDGAPLLGVRAVGVPVTRRESAAYMHLWRYVGWLMGVHPDFLTDIEAERHRINYHLLLAAADQSDAGPLLAQAAVEAQLYRAYPGWPAALVGVRAKYERERLLSMLAVFLGRQSMRELGLPPRLPWAFAMRLVTNLWVYQVDGRRPGGRERLIRAGERQAEFIRRSYFKGATEEVAHLQGTE